jgi:Cu-Zn family superoxide dismutase
MKRVMLMSSVLLLVSACTREDGSQVTQPKEPDYESPALAQKAEPDGPPHDASVQLAPTQGNQVTGSLVLTGAPDGVHITGAIQGLKPDSEVGFHIHEKGDCSAPDGSSAGAHFNPTQQQHGHPESESHHAGDMINLRADSSGVAQVDTTARGATINSGESTDVIGKAVIVHESPDDYTSQPSGNSGSRVACGVIAAAQRP